MARDTADWLVGRDNPGSNAFAITPSDSAPLIQITRGLYVGGSGNVSVVLAGDAVAVVLNGVVAGSLYPLRVKQVTATNTTATGLVGVY